MRSLTPPRRGSDETNVSTQQQETQTNARFPRSHGDARGAQHPETPTREGAKAPRRDHSIQAAALRAAQGRSLGGQRFPRLYRLRKRPEFLSLQREGRRRSAPHFTVITRLKRLPPSRLGVTASRRVGGAPARNRVRRMVREFFRRHRESLEPPRDVLVIARPGAPALSYWDVERELTDALGSGAGRR
jgi:ribonuclease P protein component